jgi:hypothetical protein
MLIISMNILCNEYSCLNNFGKKSGKVIIHSTPHNATIHDLKAFEMHALYLSLLV